MNEKSGCITEEPFGQLACGSPVTLYHLKNSRGCSVSITNYGGIITAIHVPDKNGKLDDVCLGHDRLEDYLAGHPYFGALCGRVAGRITGASFELDGKSYALAANDGPNHLHGGLRGFDKFLWDAECIDLENGPALQLSCLSPDGDEGYPGNLHVTVSYQWSEDNALAISYKITTDKDTPVTLTSHGYFNLKGEGKGDILDHRIEIFSDDYAPADDQMTLLGRREAVEETVNDFRTGVLLADRIEALHQQHGSAYFLPGGRQADVRLVARVSEEVSGRYMEVLTTEACLQFYSGMALDGENTGKRGVAYDKFAGLCLETQEYADAVNHPELGKAFLAAGDEYHSTTVYHFGLV